MKGRHQNMGSSATDTEIVDAEVVIIGSGAGGAVTAATLARAGRMDFSRNCLAVIA